ncbi:hypothetical protein [Thiohalobacter thiocyanaticus]|uniref:Uncharacterized protein n=1 Tax=Thiohalobacter thiocyanaticus TaxID=585455 RepID=A0A426QKH7_9GAMM|nr:hypothetical protein [Thiohalobacter thiocyanaticus]RRQ22265.1 hypothetical protein D6C00_10090 [Thiohalobacter thiocyanaticus]
MLILDMQEGTELESIAAAREAETQAPASQWPAPALQLQEHLRPVAERPDPELVRRTLERWLS